MKYNCIGISKENIQNIFDVFFTTRGGGKGTGQGLTIAYDMVQNIHGGDKLVDSAEGTIFTIKFPLEDPTALV